MTKDFWDERYGAEGYAYGAHPNAFLTEKLPLLNTGKVLFPCDGEGRNAVYAAQQGWTVSAFDLSEAGKAKAEALASAQGVHIDFQVADAMLVNYPEASFDLIAFTYTHLPTEVRMRLHAQAIQWLKPGGTLLLEAFHPLQLQNQSGGPKDLSMLYTEEMLTQDFSALQTQLLTVVTTILDEGPYHQGKADVIRYIGTKPA